MFGALLLLQLALPIGLLLWLWRWALGSRVGFLVQAAATGLVLAALGLAGIWLFPPWWTPAAYAALFAAAVLLRPRNARPRPAWPTPKSAWGGVGSFLAVGGVAAGVISSSLSARRPPDNPAVSLAFPLPPGSYLVVNGGGGLPLNAHVKTLDTATTRYRVWRGQSYGIDLVKLNWLGQRAGGLRPRNPERYFIFGTPVLAPCSGRVVSMTDSLPDRPVPERDDVRRAGNHVTLRCEDVDVVLAHLGQGTVITQSGDSVETGTVIGTVGNSGASDEPHLHIHAQRPGPAGAPMGGEPLPIRFGGRFLVRGQRVGVE